jgi:hypothetical protein
MDLKKQENQDNKEAGLFIANRELSWALSLALLLSFLMFCAGYFWGQRKAVAQFLYKVKEESFADNVTYSLYAMNPQEPTEDEAEESTQQEGQEIEQAEIENKEIEPIETTVPIKAQQAPTTVYVAPLVGFGTLHAANLFAQRVKKLEIPVIVKQRSSTTQRGRKIVWYQAVTEEYRDKSELEKIIAIVKQKENIKEVKIIEKKKG